MNAQALTNALAGISAAHVIGFFIVLARITPLFLVAPVFSSQLLIPNVRAVLAVALALGLAPVAMHGQTIPTDPLVVVGLMIEGALVGMVIAFATACVFAAVQGAGVLGDYESGFSYGATIDPINGNQGGALTNIYSMVGMALYLTIGGDAWTLRGLAATFHIIPLTHGPQIGSILTGAEQGLVSVSVGAIEIAAPLILAITIADIAFGMVSKVVPQLNVFAVGLPVKVGVALLLVGVSLPFIGSWLSDQMQTSVTSAIHFLQVA
jgi:flagellar biosynthetic protein FliR